MTDDWKGEDKIRIKPLTKAQRMVEDQRVIQSAVHKKRQKDGINMSRSGGQWAKTIVAWHTHGKIMKGKQFDGG